MGQKKLYRVEIQLEYFAYADSEDSARMMADDMVRDEFFLDDAAVAHPVTCKKHLIYPYGWEDTSLVYTDDGEEITLGAIVDQLPDDPPPKAASGAKAT